MICTICKIYIDKTDECKYPFNSIAIGDNKINNNGKKIGCTHGIKK